MKKTRLIAIILSLMMLVTILSACAPGGDDTPAPPPPANGGQATTDTTADDGEDAPPPAEGIITMTMYMADAGFPVDFWGTDMVSQRMIEMTGITFQFELNADGTETRQNLIVSSGDYPDLMFMGFAQLAPRTMIQDGLAYSWDNLFERFVPEAMNTEFMVRNQAILRNLYDFTDEVWTVPSGFVDRRYVDNNTFIMQSPGYYARGSKLDELGNPPLVTLDDLEDLLRLAVEHDPDLSDPLFLWNPVGIGWDANGITILYRSMGGRSVGDGHVINVMPNGNLQHIVRDPLYKETLMFVNRLYNEGLISHNNFTDGTAEQEAINVSENWVVAVGHYWRSIVPQDLFGDIRPIPHLAQPGVNYYGPVVGLNGWNGIFVPTANRYQEETAQLLATMLTDEWQGLASGGIYGEHWEWGGPYNTWLIPIGHAADLINQGFGDWMEGTGAFRYHFAAFHGLDSALAWGMASTDPFRVEIFTTQNIGQDASPWEALNPDPETSAGANLTSIGQLFNSYVAQIVTAPSQAEAEALFETMMADVEGSGLAQIEAHWNATFDARN